MTRNEKLRLVRQTLRLHNFDPAWYIFSVNNCLSYLSVEHNSTNKEGLTWMKSWFESASIKMERK